MGLRVRKRIKIAKGLYINLGKNGVSSMSTKVGNVTFNSKGRATASIPGTGISYSTTSSSHHRKQNHIEKPGWISIMFWTIVFFPVGIYKLIKKLT